MVASTNDSILLVSSIKSDQASLAKIKASAEKEAANTSFEAMERVAEGKWGDLFLLMLILIYHL